MIATIRKKKTPPSRPKGRRSKDMPDGRQALLVAATSAFASHGFDGADLRSVAAAAQVSPNLVRIHFGHKAALWEACLDRIVTIAIPAMTGVRAIAVDQSRTVGERLRDVILAIGAFYVAHPEVKDFVIRHGAETPERAALVTERLLRPSYESVRELFVAGIEAGIIRSSHPALFFALLNSALHQPPAFPVLLKQLAPDIDTEAARALLIETTVTTFLHLPPSKSCRHPT
jgi:AcrR family transcriptional regulator